jgi:hypothetical protein
VLARTRIEGQALRPDGSAIKGAKFETNLPAHVKVLEAPLLREHSHKPAEGRHVNWVVGFLRG